MGNSPPSSPSRKKSLQVAPKFKAEDNPWYLLATLYGVPGNLQDERWDRNRRAWNQYFAANLDFETRAQLVKEKGYCEAELTPFSEAELRDIKSSFAERSKGSKWHIELPAIIDFSNVRFDEKTYFSHHIFTECRFTGADFSDPADFRNSVFLKGVNFDSVNFRDEVSFIRATFSSFAEFGDATFSRAATFEQATFRGGALFVPVTFAGPVSFRSAAFFNEARFTATFKREAEFINAKMQDKTWFEGTVFKTVPPEFFGAELHEGTVWPGREAWPIPKEKDKAKGFIHAYERLKLEMDRLKKHEDELDFFTLELQSRRVLQESVLKGSGLPIQIYGLVSDYGRSYARPLYGLIAVAAFGTLMLLLSDVLLVPWQSLGMSVANTLNVFGFRKDLFDPHLFENLPAPLKILATLQTILGAILLFLFGLGVRNKFRMK